MFSTAARREVTAALIGGLSLLCSGMSFTWVTPLLNELQGPDSPVPLTADQASWMVSLIEIGNMITPIPAGIIVDRVGRKPCLLFPSIVYVATWIMVIYWKSVVSLYLMRIIQGMAMSIQYTVLPMYLGEIAGTSRRGAVSSLFQGMWYAGVLYEYVFGAVFSYDWLTWISIGPPLVFMALFAFCPESPYFLLIRGRYDEALKVVSWLRGVTPEAAAAEVKSMEDSIKQEREDKGCWSDVIGTKAGRKALVIVMVLATVEIMSGLTTVLSYVTYTFAKTSGDLNEANLVSICLAVALIAATVFSAIFCDRVGRRPILMISGFGSALCLGAAAASFFITEYKGFDNAQLSWLPYISIIIYMVLVAFGVGSLLPTLQSELFPNTTRGIACGINTLYLTGISFVCLKMYQVIGDNHGYSLCYAIFAAFAFAGTSIISFILPETKGKTFPEIQKILKAEEK